MNRAALPVRAQACIRQTVRFFESVIENGFYSGNYMAEAKDDMQEAADLIAGIGTDEQVRAANVILDIIKIEDYFGTPWAYCIRVLKRVVGDRYAGY